MVYRIYVAKKPEFANEANALNSEIKNLLKIDGIKSLSVINRSLPKVWNKSTII